MEQGNTAYKAAACLSVIAAVSAVVVSGVLTPISSTSLVAPAAVRTVQRALPVQNTYSNRGLIGQEPSFVHAASQPGYNFKSPLQNNVSAAVAFSFGTLASVMLLLTNFRRRQPALALAATTGERQLWLPGAKAPAHLTGEFPGDRGFDPLGLSKDPSSFERMRVAEVFHGRLAMLGVVGSLVPELQGKGAWFEVVNQQWGPGPNGEVIGVTELGLISLLVAYPLEYWRGNGGFGWAEQEGDRNYPGFDPLNLASEEYKLAEIKNGRLAMTALLGFAIQANATGQSPLTNLAAVTGGSVAMFAASGERKLWFPGAQAPAHLTGEFPGDRGFDPVDFGADAKTFERMRASEVFHGRLAMLGVAGTLAPELLGKGAWFQAGDSVDLAQVGLTSLLLIAPVEYWRGNGGFGWDQKEKQKGNRIYPGFDPLKLGSDRNKEAEIKNGRLAMVAMIGFFSQANATGVSPLANLAGVSSVAMFAATGVKA